ncbi:hypothetical protein OROGR_031177 [Orobanche gracilis]
MTRGAAEDVGSLLGEILDIKSDYDEVALGECVRICTMVDVRKNLHTMSMERLAMKMWGIWKERCDLSHKKGNRNTRNGQDISANWTDNLLEQVHLETMLSASLSIRATGYHTSNPPETVMATELKGIIEAFWSDISQRKIMVLSDSMESIQAIKSNSIYKGYEENFIERARTLTENISVKGVWYCPRSNNTAAHKMATLECKSPHPQAWVDDDIPRHICL